MAIEKDTPQDARGGDSRRRAGTRATSQRRASSKSRQRKPPANVTPGWIHKAVADGILRSAAGRIQSETGQEFSVGNLDEVEKELAGIIEGREPVDILARVLAHI